MNEDFNVKDALVLIGMVPGGPVPQKKDKVLNPVLH
jgi:hypothetical protein